MEDASNQIFWGADTWVRVIDLAGGREASLDCVLVVKALFY